MALRLTSAANPAYGAGILQGLAHAEALPDPTPIFDAIRHIASFQHASNDQLLGLALRRYFGSDIPDDVIQLVIDRALHAADPPSDAGADREEDTPHGEDEAVYARGINSARGQAAEVLGDIVANDADGSRTSLVLPVLDQLAEDPSIAVRSCVAHVISACLLHARPAATGAFTKLVQANDRLLACRHVERLMMYLGDGGAVDAVRPMIERMLASDFDDVGEAGGRLAAFAGLEWRQGDLLLAARSSERLAIRKGVASLCANCLPRSTDTLMATETLMLLMNDPEEGVRKAVAQVAGRLRDKRLRPYASLLSDLISSDSYTQALPQLLITLEHAPDRVDKLAIECTKRFVALFSADAGDMSTRAAGEAQQVGQLVLRAYTQATSAAARREALNLVDELLVISAIGFTDLVSVAERD